MTDWEIILITCFILMTLIKVCTKIVEKNANPEWNQLIYLQVKVGRVLTWKLG